MRASSVYKRSGRYGWRLDCGYTAKGSRRGRIRGASAIEGVVNQTFKVLWRGKQPFMEVGKKGLTFVCPQDDPRAYTGPVELIDKGLPQARTRRTELPGPAPRRRRKRLPQNDKLELLWSCAKELIKDGSLGKTELVKALGGRKAATLEAVNGWLEGGKLVGGEAWSD